MKTKTVPDYSQPNDRLKDDYDEQLLQLTSLTWDGELISKTHTIVLCQMELAQKLPGGWNIITASGIEKLHIQNKIHP